MTPGPSHMAPGPLYMTPGPSYMTTSYQHLYVCSVLVKSQGIPRNTPGTVTSMQNHQFLRMTCAFSIVRRGILLHLLVVSNQNTRRATTLYSAQVASILTE